MHWPDQCIVYLHRPLSETEKKTSLFKKITSRQYKRCILIKTLNNKIMNTDNVIYIPTDKIQKIAVSADFNIKNPYIVDDGDWDINGLMDFSESFIYTSLFEMIINQKKWEDTELYSNILNKMKKGEPKWGCDTIDKCVKRGTYLMNLYEDIKSVGRILSREDLLKFSNLKTKNFYGKNDCIQVVIGRHGQILFASNGSHRLSIAKILKFPYVPAMVHKRHNQWENYRKEVVDICQRRWGGKTYQKLFHPDLEFIETMHPDNRYDYVNKNTNLKGATLLDLGSLFGYICYRGELDGFKCTAVEQVKDFTTVMKKMKDALDMKFDIIKGDMFNMQNNTYDIIVAFNIFHHFIKTEGLHEKLIGLLKKLEYKEMFVQFHKTHEQQMIGAYKNYNDEEFAKFIISHSKNKTSYECVGNIGGRKIYKIY